LIENYPEVREIDPREITKYHPPAWIDKAIERGDTLYTVDISLEFEEQIETIIDAMELLYPSREFDKMVKTPMSKDLFVYAERVLKSDRKRSGVEETGIHYSDGSRWVKLKAFETIKWEGDEMANCLKKWTNNYYKEIQSGTAEVYSLRDANNKPRITVYAFHDQEVKQAKGYENSIVSEKYASYVYDLILKKGFVVDLEKGSEQDLDNVGLFWGGKFYRNYEAIPVKERWFDLLKRWKNVFKVCEKVEACLKEGIDPDLRESSDQKTALGLAVEYNYPVCIEALCRHGADPMLRPQGEPFSPLQTVMTYTIRFDKQRGIQYLEQMLPNTSPDKLVDEDGYSLLFKLVGPSGGFAEQEALKRLIDFGADVNATSSSGFSLLQVAVRNGNYLVIDEILRHNPDINYAKYVHVLDLGIRDKTLIEVLLDHGASPKYAKSPILPVYTFKHPKDTSLILRFLKGGAEVNAVDETGSTALMFVCAYNKQALELSKKFIEYGARVDIKNKGGLTVFDFINHDRQLSDEEAEELRTYLEQQ
jgi:ankyrin repeat protein